MDGVKPPAVHAFEHHQMPARIRDRDRNRDPDRMRALHRDGGDAPGPLVSETLGGGDVHDGARGALRAGGAVFSAEEKGSGKLHQVKGLIKAVSWREQGVRSPPSPVVGAATRVASVET